jgi:hypothetical protein
MPYAPAEIVEAYASGIVRYPNGNPLAPDAAEAWQSVCHAGAGPLGSARVRDSARREWVVEPRRDPSGRRILVFSPAHGDLEPFRASADGHRPETHLAIGGDEWTLLALLATGRTGDAGREDAELRAAAFRLVDGMVREAQHRLLMGAADEEDEA